MHVGGKAAECVHDSVECGDSDVMQRGRQRSASLPSVISRIVSQIVRDRLALLVRTADDVDHTADLADADFGERYRQRRFPRP